MNLVNNSVLVFALQGIGNNILALPALKHMKAETNSTISVVISNFGGYEIFKRLDFIDRLYVWDEKLSVFKNLFRLQRQLRVTKFDHALSLVPNGKRENILLSMANADKKLSYKYSDATFRLLGFLNRNAVNKSKDWHDSEANLYLLDYKGNLFNGVSLVDIPNVTEEKYAEALLKKGKSSNFFTVHPGARGQRRGKQWEKNKFVKLTNRLITDYELRAIIVGGEDELKLREEMATKILNDPIVLKNVRLTQLIAIMSRTRFFIGNDSGPMHIASTLNLPLIIIWGCTDYNAISPLSDNAILFRKKIKCSPCYSFIKPREIKCNHNYECINGLGVDEIYYYINRFVNSIILNKQKEFKKQDKIVSNEHIIKLKNGPLLINMV
jgi:ADP-heptose:LPS heptosyltransferase